MSAKDPKYVIIGIANHDGSSPEKPISAPLIAAGQEPRGLPLRWRKVHHYSLGDTFAQEWLLNGEWVEVPCVK